MTEDEFMEEYYFSGVDAARRCHYHPGVKISSDDGMFDGFCHICEGESFDAMEMWEYDPSNAQREHCFLPDTHMVTHSVMPWTCMSFPIPEDDIPF